MKNRFLTVNDPFLHYVHDLRFFSCTCTAFLDSFETLAVIVEKTGSKRQRDRIDQSDCKRYQSKHKQEKVSCTHSTCHQQNP